MRWPWQKRWIPPMYLYEVRGKYATRYVRCEAGTVITLYDGESIDPIPVLVIRKGRWVR